MRMRGAPQGPGMPHPVGRAYSFFLNGYTRLIQRLGLGPKVASASLWSLVIKGIYTLLGFLSTVLLARFLGAQAYGIYAFTWSLVWVLAMPAQAGLPNLVVRETARGIAQQRPEMVRGVWVWSSRMVAILSLALVLLAAAFLVPWFGRTSSFDAITLAWGLALTPLLALGNLRGAALRGLQRVVAGQLPELVIRPAVFLLFFMGAILLARSHLTAATAMALQAGASLVAFLAGARMLLASVPGSVRNASPAFQAKTWLTSSLLFGLITGFQMLNKQVSTLILGLFEPPAAVGIYRVAVQVSMVAGFGLEAVNAAVGPRFADLYAQRKIADLQHLATAGARIALAFTMAVTATFLLLGSRFFGAVFGADFGASYVPLAILLVGQLVNAAAGSVGALLNMSGYERYTARGLAVAAAANIALNFLLVPTYGIRGAAIGTAAAMVLWNVLLWNSVKRRLGIDSSAVSHLGAAPSLCKTERWSPIWRRNPYLPMRLLARRAPQSLRHGLARLMEWMLPQSAGLVIFHSVPDYSGNAKALYLHVREHHPEARCLWIVDSYTSQKALATRGVEAVIRGSPASLIALARAEIIATTHIYPFAEGLRRAFLLNLWHGLSLKGVGATQNNAPPIDLEYLMRYGKRTTLSIASSQLARGLISTSRGIDANRIEITGYPRNDWLLAPDGRRNLERALGTHLGSHKAVLYAPTCRDERTSHLARAKPIMDTILSDLLRPEVERALQEWGMDLIVKLHPYEEGRVAMLNRALRPPLYLLDSNRLFAADLDLYQLLGGVDILITDLSSIAFDFLLLDRPILFFVPDFEEYSTARGLKLYPGTAWMPGPMATNVNELMCELAAAASGVDRHAEHRARVAAALHEVRDADSSRRVWEAIERIRSRPFRGGRDPLRGNSSVVGDLDHRAEARHQ